VLEAFLFFDRDGDGFIEKTEVDPGIKALRQNLSLNPRA